MGVGISKGQLALYTKEEIGEVVSSYGDKYRGYAKKMIANGIDGSFLASLGDGEIKGVLDDLNISSRVHQRKLIHVFRSLRSRGPATSLQTSATAAAQRKASSQRLANSLHTEATTNEFETDDSFSSFTSNSAVVDTGERDNVDTSLQPILENFQMHLQQQVEIHERLVATMKQLEQSNLQGQSRAEKMRPPQDHAVLVLTDVAYSTMLWESDPMAMRKALTIHDKIMRRLIGKHFGFESDTEGDSFYLAFHEASDAVAFALALQEELHEAPWPDEILTLTYKHGDHRKGLRVRVAINMGKVESMPNPVTHRTQYFGSAFNATRTIEKMAEGGQILTTDETWNAALRQLDMKCFDIPKVAYLNVDPSSWYGCTFQHILELAPSKFPLSHH